MGNHEAGHAMVQTATALAAQRHQTGQSAMEILDIACKPWMHVGDPEFDEQEMPGTPFGDLLVEAFSPGFVYDPDSEDDGEEAWDAWWDAVGEPFAKRYNNH